VEGGSQEESGGLVKQLTFGKLPECLCFHIQRTGTGEHTEALEEHTSVRSAYRHRGGTVLVRWKKQLDQRCERFWYIRLALFEPRFKNHGRQNNKIRSMWRGLPLVNS
jgi:hypothetical protein